MSYTIVAANFSPQNVKDQAILDAATIAGATSFTLQYAAELSVNDFFYIGTPATEYVEKLKVQAVTGLIVTTTTGAVNPHARGEQLQVVKGDQIKFYRAADAGGTIPVDGNFSSLVTVNITPDLLTTAYNDPTGSTAYWYKYTYYNSSSLAETQLADSAALRGGDFGHYVSIAEIRQVAGMVNSVAITDLIIDIKRRDAEAEINVVLSPIYTIPLATPTPPIIARIARTLAAGLLMLDQYGLQATGTGKDGMAKVDEARLLLDKIGNRTMIVADIYGNQLAVKTIFNGWPDSSAATYNTDNPTSTDPFGGDRMFRISGKTF